MVRIKKTILLENNLMTCTRSLKKNVYIKLSIKYLRRLIYLSLFTCLSCLQTFNEMNTDNVNNPLMMAASWITIQDCDQL